MPLDSNKIADLRVKHLEMLQAVVARISGQGATLKNYCLTVSTTICGFAVTLQRPLVALLALLPITIFMLLDAQYLRVERRFRAQFERVRTEDWGVTPTFEINAKQTPDVAYATALGGWSIMSFYAPLAFAVVIVVIVSGFVYGRLV